MIEFGVAEGLGDASLHAFELVERQAINEPIGLIVPRRALDHDMRFEGEAEQLVKRDLAVTVEEHGAHAGDVLTLPTTTVRFIDAHPHGRAMLRVAPGEHRQFVRQQVHMLSERITAWLFRWLGVRRGLEREPGSILVQHGQKPACVVEVWLEPRPLLHATAGLARHGGRHHCSIGRARVLATAQYE